VRVRSIPPSDRQAMADTLASYALMVSMSDFETHPLAVVEALSVGCPVLVAQTSGLLEIAEDGLARSLPLDAPASAVASAIVEELRSPRPPVSVDLPTWDHCAEDLLAIYREVLSGRDTVATVTRPAPEESQTGV